MTDGSIPVGGTITKLDTVILNPRVARRTGGGGAGIPNPKGGQGSAFSVDIPEEDDRILLKAIKQFVEGQP